MVYHGLAVMVDLLAEGLHEEELLVIVLVPHAKGLGPQFGKELERRGVGAQLFWNDIDEHPEDLAHVTVLPRFVWRGHECPLVPEDQLLLHSTV